MQGEQDGGQNMSREIPSAVAGSQPQRWLGVGLFLFALFNIVMTCLRADKPEWLAALWLGAFFAWLGLCLWSLKAAVLLLLAGLPLFGARPGDLVTNGQDSLIVVLASVSLWRYPIRIGKRPAMLLGWLFAGFALLSVVANYHRCFYPLRPFHQDHLTWDVFFMFAESWDRTIGISEWFVLLNMLIVARLVHRQVMDRQCSIGLFGAAVSIGLFVALAVGYAEYFWPRGHELLTKYQLRLYDFSNDKPPQTIPLPSWLVSPAGRHVAMKSLFGNRGWFGQYLLVAGPVAMAWLGYRRELAGRVAAGLLAGALAVALVLCGSRTALFSISAGGVLVAVLYLLAATRARRHLSRTVASWFLLALLVACIPLPPLLWHWMGTSGLMEPHSRDIAWRGALELSREHPWLGVGYESFGLALREKALEKHDKEYLRNLVITAHNFFTQIAVCTGTGGLLCIVLLFHRPLQVLLATIGRSDAGHRSLAGFAVALLLVFIGGFGQHWFYSHSTALFWWVACALVRTDPGQTPAGANDQEGFR